MPTPVWWIGAAAAGALVFGSAGLLYLGLVLAWQDARTRGDRYFGLPPRERAAFRRRLRLHARLLRPLLALLARATPGDLARATFREQGLSGPSGSCSPESFRNAAAYAPDPSDVFVVTQMRSGTTWMVHLVVQVLTRGRADLAAEGRALHAVSPWLEGLRTVNVEHAPVVGHERPSRVIKTHLPVEVCPFSSHARYVYVARNPASCFASCVDYLAASLGAFAPDLPDLERWFCSHEAMWWGSWPRHVDGWWQQAGRHDNVLFVRFEEMTADLGAVARRLADFLSIEPLDEAEHSDVVRKCSLQAMRAHRECFAMQPPSLVGLDSDLLPSGAADRDRDLPDDIRKRVVQWCAAEAEGTTLPLHRWYPAEVS